MRNADHFQRNTVFRKKNIEEINKNLQEKDWTIQLQNFQIQFIRRSAEDTVSTISNKHIEEADRSLSLKIPFINEKETPKMYFDKILNLLKEGLTTEEKKDFEKTDLFKTPLSLSFSYKEIGEKKEKTVNLMANDTSSQLQELLSFAFSVAEKTPNCYFKINLFTNDMSQSNELEEHLKNLRIISPKDLEEKNQDQEREKGEKTHPEEVSKKTFGETIKSMEDILKNLITSIKNDDHPTDKKTLSLKNTTNALQALLIKTDQIFNLLSTQTNLEVKHKKLQKNFKNMILRMQWNKSFVSSENFLFSLEILSKSLNTIHTSIDNNRPVSLETLLRTTESITDQLENFLLDIETDIQQKASEKNLLTTQNPLFLKNLSQIDNHDISPSWKKSLLQKISDLKGNLEILHYHINNRTASTEESLEGASSSFDTTKEHSKQILSSLENAILQIKESVDLGINKGGVKTAIEFNSIAQNNVDNIAKLSKEILLQKISNLKENLDILYFHINEKNISTKEGVKIEFDLFDIERKHSKENLENLISNLEIPILLKTQGRGNRLPEIQSVKSLQYQKFRFTANRLPKSQRVETPQYQSEKEKTQRDEFSSDQKSEDEIENGKLLHSSADHLVKTMNDLVSTVLTAKKPKNSTDTPQKVQITSTTTPAPVLQQAKFESISEIQIKPSEKTAVSVFLPETSEASTRKNPTSSTDTPQKVQITSTTTPAPVLQQAKFESISEIQIKPSEKTAVSVFLPETSEASTRKNPTSSTDTPQKVQITSTTTPALQQTKFESILADQWEEIDRQWREVSNDQKSKDEKTVMEESSSDQKSEDEIENEELLNSITSTTTPVIQQTKFESIFADQWEEIDRQLRKLSNDQKEEEELIHSITSITTPVIQQTKFESIFADQWEEIDRQLREVSNEKTVMEESSSDQESEDEIENGELLHSSADHLVKTMNDLLSTALTRKKARSSTDTPQKIQITSTTTPVIQQTKFESFSPEIQIKPTEDPLKELDRQWREVSNYRKGEEELTHSEKFSTDVFVTVPESGERVSSSWEELDRQWREVSNDQKSKDEKTVMEESSSDQESEDEIENKELLYISANHLVKTMNDLLSTALTRKKPRSSTDTPQKVQITSTTTPAPQQAKFKSFSAEIQQTKLETISEEIQIKPSEITATTIPALQKAKLESISEIQTDDTWKEKEVVEESSSDQESEDEITTWEEFSTGVFVHTSSVPETTERRYSSHENLVSLSQKIPQTHRQIGKLSDYQEAEQDIKNRELLHSSANHLGKTMKDLLSTASTRKKTTSSTDTPQKVKLTSTTTPAPVLQQAKFESISEIQIKPSEKTAVSVFLPETSEASTRKNPTSSTDTPQKVQITSTTIPAPVLQQAKFKSISASEIQTDDQQWKKSPSVASEKSVKKFTKTKRRLSSNDLRKIFFKGKYLFENLEKDKLWKKYGLEETHPRLSKFLRQKSSSLKKRIVPFYNERLTSEKLKIVIGNDHKFLSKNTLSLWVLQQFIEDGFKQKFVKENISEEALRISSFIALKNYIVKNPQYGYSFWRETFSKELLLHFKHKLKTADAEQRKKIENTNLFFQYLSMEEYDSFWEKINLKTPETIFEQIATDDSFPKNVSDKLTPENFTILRKNA